MSSSQTVEAAQGFRPPNPIGSGRCLAWGQSAGYRGGMTSVPSATTPPTFATEAAALLRELEAATTQLARAETIPYEVALLVKELGDRLHASDPIAGMPSVAPDVRTELLAAALLCRDAVENGSRRELRLQLEHVRHLVRDVVDEAPANPDRDPREMLRWLVEVVGAPQGEIAELLRVAPRSLQRWLSEKDRSAPTGDDLARVSVVTAIVAHLRHSFTGPGTLHWFTRPHPALGNRPPAGLLDDPLTYPQLTALASRARSMLAG